MTHDSNVIGKFSLSGTVLMLRTVPQINLTFDIGTDGILNALAIEKLTGK